jgi:16S rRNA (uracil1498-N3)-methyltransferase
MIMPCTLPRFFVPPACIQEDAIQLPPEVIHQLFHVLRLSKGDSICVLDNTGKAYHVTLHDKQSGTGQVETVWELDSEPKIEYHLLQSLIKSEKAEWVIRLCTQAGVKRILFAPSERSIVKWDEAKRQSREQRWQRIAQEEAELACRARIPDVRILMNWEQTLSLLPPPLILPYEGETGRLLIDLLKTLRLEKSLSVIIGPEGGFSAEEVERMEQLGCMTVSLGPRILRTESAAFFAMAQMNFWIS